MSVLIKGMEMPQCCGECKFMVDRWCYASEDAYFVVNKRHPDCPLVEVPTPIVCNMQLNDFEEMWKDVTDGYAYGDYLVRLMYKYDFEHSYRTSIEVVTISPDGFIWFNDWNEGEKNVIVQSYISIDDLYNILLSP